MSSNAPRNSQQSPNEGPREFCRVCGAAGSVPYLAAPGDGGDEWRLVSCPRCSFVWLADPPAPERIAHYYPPEYYGRSNDRFTGPGEAFEAWCRRRRATDIARLREPGSILDIGCGRGLMLATLRDRGWRVTGTELSEHAAHHARRVLGLDVRIGDLESCGLDGEAFDVVTLWHVLEHVPDARRCLEHIRRRMKPDGLLIVAVPNIESLEARLAGRHWFHLDLPRHESHFSPRTLRRMLTSVGFTPVRMKRFSLEYGPYGMLQSLLNRMGFQHNLLYDALKAPGARAPWPASGRRRTAQLLATALLLPTLAPLSALLHLVDGLAFGGSCIEIHAVPTTEFGTDTEIQEVST